MNAEGHVTANRNKSRPKREMAKAKMIFEVYLCLSACICG